MASRSSELGSEVFHRNTECHYPPLLISHLPLLPGEHSSFAPGAMLRQRQEVLLSALTNARKHQKPQALISQPLALTRALLCQPTAETTFTFVLLLSSLFETQLKNVYPFSGRISATASALGPAWLSGSQHLL